MPDLPDDCPPFPPSTRVESIALDQLNGPNVRWGLQYWERLRGTRQWPSRGDIKPREFALLLSHVSLFKVLDGGADFEIRVIGDCVAKRHRMPLLRRRVSEIESAYPNEAQRLRSQHYCVVETGSAQAWRMVTGQDAREVTFSSAEIVRMPLSDDGSAVDHVLSFANYTDLVGG